MLAAKSRPLLKARPKGTADHANPVPDSARAVKPRSLWDRLATAVQTKLAVNVPGDSFEREADTVAHAVMHAGSETPTAINRRTSDSAQRVAESAAENAISSPRSGQPLDADARTFMESHFGHDFSDVRVHASGPASASARALNARAYTVGRDVVFDQGQYNSGTNEGRTLLAHELAHVVQQRPHSKRASAAPRLQRQVYGPAAPTGAGSDFDNYLLQVNALEQAAITDGYAFNDRITAFRKLYYDSASTAKTYAGAVIGGGAFNILIPAAAGTKIPPSWSTPPLDGAADYLRKHQVLKIAGQSIDIGHLLAGADAAKHPTSVSLGGRTINLRSNVEAATFVGDLGSVVTEYIKGSRASFYDTAMKRSTVLDSYYDGSKAMASAEDMAGNADAYALILDPSKTLGENLKDYYAATTGGVKKRFTSFAAAIGLGTLKGASFTGDTKTWRTAMTEQVFNAALAYAAGKGWKSDVILVLKDPGTGLITPTFWEMYWNNSEWVVDIFVDRMKRDVAKE